jgi:hypothetical protein
MSSHQDGEECTARHQRRWPTITLGRFDQLFILFVIITLVGVLIPIRHIAHQTSWKTTCGNHQRQIVLAMLVYDAEHDNERWPCRPTDASGHATNDPAAIDGFCTAAASLEMLLRQGNDLTLECFVCPANPATAQYLSPPGPHGMTYDHGVSQWGVTHQADCAGGPSGMAYAYDWSSPTWNKWGIVLADRGNGDLAHKNIAMAAADDGHVVAIPLDDLAASPRPVGAHVTLGLDGKPESMTSRRLAGRSATIDDDIYDDAGDGDMGMPDHGTATRSWVR